MALWMVRAGQHGEREEYALQHGVAVIGWEEVGDLAGVSSAEELKKHLLDTYPETKPATIRNWTGQVWAFVGRMQIGDLVALPLKSAAAIAFGRVTGGYRYDPAAPSSARHQRPVEWVREDVPRASLDQDLLYSLGAFMTVCQIKRNEAEDRVKALLAGTGKKDESTGEEIVDPLESLDLETFSRDQITKHVGTRFKGHELARLVDEVLVAHGYVTQRSPAGPDGGVDVLGGLGPMGFDGPKLCVQVKSSDAPVDARTVRELQGVMSSFGADRGLLVAWGGFNKGARDEARRLFFQIRLWDSDDLIRQVLQHYDKLPAETEAEIPLTRIWALVQKET